MFRNNRPGKPAQSWPEDDLVKAVVTILIRDFGKSWREVRQIGLRIVAATPASKPQSAEATTRND